MSVWSSTPGNPVTALHKCFDEGRQDTLVEFQALHFIADNTMAIYNCKNALKCFSRESCVHNIKLTALHDVCITDTL